MVAVERGPRETLRSRASGRPVFHLFLCAGESLRIRNRNVLASAVPGDYISVICRSAALIQMHVGRRSRVLRQEQAVSGVWYTVSESGRGGWPAAVTLGRLLLQVATVISIRISSRPHWLQRV